VDAGQINQVIVNLAVNARDAMPEGGCLTLETRNVERRVADEAAPDGYRLQKSVLLCVTDTGVGMRADVKSRVFEPFFTTKEVGRGTGLGLAVVHGIIQQSEGEIEVETAEGKGTSFRIYLPAVAPAITPPAETRDLPPGGGSETILLVEDDDLVRKFAAHALEPFGYTILKARSGDQALQMAASHPGKIHLLVTDVVMPGMNGRLVAEALRARNPALRVLFLSGYTDDAVMRHGIRQAEVAFLQKPVSPRVLAAKVRELLDQPSMKPGRGSEDLGK
jgi:CheY-like chemotaxis protein